MKTKEILQSVAHRPWEIPTGRWKFYQEWNNAIFLHWEVSLEALQNFVPKGFEIDTINGKPWVSLVAFNMEKIRPHCLPALAPISNFHEINVRTYVKYKGKQGVYFLSIEGGNPLSCKLAKAISGLPYRYSKMMRESNWYHSDNRDMKDQFIVNYDCGERIKKKTNLDKWLTERYALFVDVGHNDYKYEIHHVEWPIQKLFLNQIEVNYNRFKSLINNTPDLMHYSKGVEVIAWGREEV